MPLDQKAIIKQIDDVLGKCNSVASTEETSKAINLLLSAIQRLAPPDGVYINSAKRYEERFPQLNTMFLTLEPLRGILLALRSDYESGYMQSVVELVHADIFADFLEMADYLLEQGYKDPAAVVTGSVLEAHLRKLCDKNRIAVVKDDGKPKKADTLNAELAAAGIYSKLDHKNVTAWLDLRNKAAHGHYAEYTKEQVTLMVQAVRDFITRNSA